MNATTINTGVNSLSFSIVNRGIGGYCDKYNVDALQIDGVNIVFQFTHWDDANRKYYLIPVSVNNIFAVMVEFSGLDIQEDEPGALLLRGCDDETAAKVGYYAAVLDGEITKEVHPAADTDLIPWESDLTDDELNALGLAAFGTPANTPETTTPENDTTMNETTNTIREYTTNALYSRNDKSKWDKAVTEYAIELVESLEGWDKEPQSVAQLREMLLNGAANWIEYSYGGSSLIYNEDIAKRCCTPSELKRVYNKHGELNSYANKIEMWVDVQARALCQAERRIINIAYKYFTA